MKLWNTEDSVDSMIESFTVGNDRTYDVRLARWDVVGSIAHACMLGAVGLITPEEARQLEHGLSELLAEIDAKGFEIEDDVEDVHSQVEKILTERLGEVGKKIHIGRSRNDQVLVDMKLFLRHELRSIRHSVLDTAELFLTSALEHQNTLLPGYTHFQVAMPSSFGLWFGGYAEALLEDARFLSACIDAANANPLGSAAGYGSSLPLDREQTTNALRFDRMHVTSTYAQMSRGRTELVAATGISMIAATISRFAMDAVMYASQNYGFISLPEAFTTGSSMMPHKRNPDVMEVLRARCNRLQALPIEIRSVMGNLPSGYHRDMQFIKDRIIPAIDEINVCLNVLGRVVQEINVVSGIMSNDMYRHAFTLERVNQLQTSGMSFRDAYHQVAAEVQSGTIDEFVRSESITTDVLSHADAHIGSISRPGLDLLRVRLNDARTIS